MTATNINRAALLKIASLVRPALAQADYVPALTHIQFANGFATAFNDITAISVEAPGIDLNRVVPGDLLIRTLGAFSGEHVGAAFDEMTSVLLLTSGRSKIKLPTLPDAAFPYEPPTDVGEEVLLTPDILKGIERCLMSVGSNDEIPAQMGVTLEPGEKALLWSTDSITMSRYQTETKITLRGDTPVMLPTFFCEQLLSLAKAFPKAEPWLVMMPGALFIDFTVEIEGKTGPMRSVASLYTKTPVDFDLIDFGGVVNKFFTIGEAVKAMVKIPDALDAAFGRALLVLSNEIVKTTNVSADGKEMTLYSTSQMGDSEDTLSFPAKSKQFSIDPTLVVRGLKGSTKIALLPKVLVLGDDTGKYLHIVAHIGG